VPADPIGDDNPIEAILLTAFPNPERVGCPGQEVIEKMAEQKVPADDAAWSHLWNCSPCFRDFKILRDARVARVEKEFDRRRTRRHVLTGAVAVVLSSALAYIGAVEFRSRPRQVVSITVDLRNANATRGSASPVARLPQKLDEVHLLLPSGTSPGAYVIAILESATDNSAIALASAKTTQSGNTLAIVGTVDLANLHAGPYFLGIRREVDGHQEEPTLYPVLISD
jgi:hypothetical protein